MRLLDLLFSVPLCVNMMSCVRLSKKELVIAINQTLVKGIFGTIHSMSASNRRGAKFNATFLQKDILTDRDIRCSFQTFDTNNYDREKSRIQI